MSVLPSPQTPDDYLVVRVQLVHVRKSFGGPKDEVIGYRAIIEPTSESAVKLASKVMSYADAEKSSTEVIKVK
jgi:hypothetical protein